MKFPWSLGQPLSTLSGGERQRVKLAKDLYKKGNIYVLDEPTTGLHASDVNTVMELLDGLVDRGNTVIVIEHNLDVMKRADWLIDVGPDGGTAGGEIVFTGTPREMAEYANVFEFDNYEGQPYFAVAFLGYGEDRRGFRDRNS